MALAFSTGYHDFMTLKTDLIAYQARWEEGNQVIRAERRSASLELRWRQLNAVCALANTLRLRQPDASEMEVFGRWAKRKEKAVSQPPQA